MTKDAFVSDIFLILCERLGQPLEVIKLFDNLSSVEQASIVFRLFEMLLDDSDAIERIRVLLGDVLPSPDPLSSKRETELLLSALAVGFRPKTTNHPLGMLREISPYRFDLTSQALEDSSITSPSVGVTSSLS